MIKILIADDHQLLIDGIKTALDKVNDIDVVAEAYNGAKVLELLNAGLEVDVILMDINMPIIDGLQCTKIVGQQFPEIRIIVLSQFGEMRFVKQMIKYGAAGYLLKDVGKGMLIDAIRKVHRGGEFYFDRFALTKIRSEMHDRADVNLFPKLTDREIEILELIAKGMSTHDLADKLCLSVHTIEAHRNHILNKSRVKNSAELIRWAILNGLIE